MREFARSLHGKISIATVEIPQVQILGLVALMGGLCGLPNVANAAVMYTYTGNNFTGFYGATSCPLVCSIQGYFIMPSPLAANLTSSDTVAPLWLHFSDGLRTMESAPASSDIFKFVTDSTGLITEWSIDLYDLPGPAYFATIHAPSGFSSSNPTPGSVLADITGVQDGSPIYTFDWSFQYGPITLINGFETISPDRWAVNINNHGIWTSQLTDFISPVPEPTTPALFGAGLAGLTAMRRRRKCSHPSMPQ